jgi:hypothetical protein
MADKQTVLALTVAWLDAYDADKSWRYTNSAMAEKSILDAIRWAMKNGDTLLLDDLHNALSHVDGCGKSCMDKMQTLRAAMFEAEKSLAAAGWPVSDYRGIESLMHYLDDPLVERRMANMLDYMDQVAA